MAGKTTTDRLSGTDRALQVGMAALGAILLFGALGVVIASAVGPQSPAFVEVVETGREVIAGRTRLRVEAVNRGEVTAATVTIQATAAGRMTTATLDYVPGRSRTPATLTFDGDLGTAPVTLEATGWVDP